MNMVNIADFKDPNDPKGRSYREVNNATKHNIPVGKLVEMESGVRLFVVKHGRDCDGTPLYELCADRDDTTQERKGFRNSKWIGGYSEDGLKVI